MLINLCCSSVFFFFWKKSSPQLSLPLHFSFDTLFILNSNISKISYFSPPVDSAWPLHIHYSSPSSFSLGPPSSCSSCPRLSMLSQTPASLLALFCLYSRHLFRMFGSLRSSCDHCLLPISIDLCFTMLS